MIWSILRLFACNPDREVVKVASPVAKIIADDILKNGIPKSLKDIDGLPYKLEGCTKKYIYWNNHTKVQNKQNANWMEIFLNGHFNVNKKLYLINIRNALDLEREYNSEITFKLFNGETRTGIEYYFDYSKEKNQFILEKGSGDNPLIYDSKKTGICFRWGH